jgi:SpoVK/Ycf46/Vps4 family AAA+-type ATPase
MKQRQTKRGSHLHGRLRRHLGAEPATLAVVETTFPTHHRPNLQLAIEQLLSREGVQWELDGMVMRQEYESPSLAKLSRKSTARDCPPGPVEYHDTSLADGKSLACVKQGIFFIRTASETLAMLISPTRYSHPPQIKIELMSADRDAAQDFMRELKIATEKSPAYRGHVLSLDIDCYHSMSVQFHRLPQITREQIILPAAVLDRIDRHAASFVKHADRLRSAGRHLKRGILLHGPPGTGKTLCAMYLASQMPGRTVMMLTGGGIGSIETCGAMARSLAPATIVLEDVDLIGTVREHQTVGANALLFELLNQMDGLAEDADVLFVLTSNRPELLEPALASRPGRIDQAIEIPPARRRLSSSLV